MKSILPLILVISNVAFAAEDREHYEIRQVKVREVAEPVRMQMSAERQESGIGLLSCSQNSPSKPFGALPGFGLTDSQADAGDLLNPLHQLDLIVDQVINIGKKIFSIIKAGQPVMNLKTDVATALPAGAGCWLDLQGWQVPQSRVYEMAFVNGFGASVVKMTYRVLWLPGGTVDGVGQYIGYATMTPVDVSVSWGFSLNAQVSVPTVFNMGTRQAPVAGMQMDMQYRIETPFKVTEQGQAYFVSGNGQFQQLQ